MQDGVGLRVMVLRPEKENSILADKHVVLGNLGTRGSPDSKPVRPSIHYLRHAHAHPEQLEPRSDVKRSSSSGLLRSNPEQDHISRQPPPQIEVNRPCILPRRWRWMPQALQTLSFHGRGACKVRRGSKLNLLCGTSLENPWSFLQKLKILMGTYR
jgi:hypothetical protein